MATDKRCALIRQTWYDAARKRMKDGERLAFYEMCFEYEFYGREPADTLFDFDNALLMFEMVRDALDHDREKSETIAMRNRRNGMLGGRPRKDSGVQEDLSNLTKPTETHENPENPDGNFGVSTTLHYTTLQAKDKSLSLRRPKTRHKDIDKYNFFRVMLVFFVGGAPDPAAETEKFYNYYGARDWKVSGGVPVRDKVKLAQTWEIKDAVSGLISARSMYAGLISAIDPEEPELLTNFVAMIRDDEAKSVVIRMTGGNQVAMILEERYLAPMSIYFRDELKLGGYNLMYQEVRS